MSNNLLKIFLVTTFLPLFAIAQKTTSTEKSRLTSLSKKVTIIRDQWSVPHIYGKTDADVVFGLLYAECEDNFKAVERNYLSVLGRTAEADGSASVYDDLLMRLTEDSTEAIRDYNTCPPNFKKLLNAFADGVNYYLYKHPETKPAVLKHFEPWYPLMFTDGSVGATITGGITLDEVKDFYGKDEMKLGRVNKPDADLKETGSNGFAISPSRSATGNAMLYINPHVPFYFRCEAQLISEEGLNVYGAVTWGQFFVYQGFNQHCGWMHTTSNADVADLYAEKIIKNGNELVYAYNNQLKPVTSKKKVINYKSATGLVKSEFTTYYTHHGPVMGARNGNWLTLKANNRSFNALLESWQITKANSFEEYKKAMALLSNATNNTVYADDKGNTAFWYGNFVPKRDPQADWTLPVDGTTTTTEWHGAHSLDEIVHVYNPASGYIQNCNATPYASAGVSSPDKSRYPAYMAPDGQNFRGVNAIKLLTGTQKLTIDSLMLKGYDHYLAAFDVLLPALFNAYQQSTDSLKHTLAEPIALLKQWDKRVSANSIQSTLALQWGQLMLDRLPRSKTIEEGTFATKRIEDLSKNMATTVMVNLFAHALNDLQTKFGTWKVQWGDLNRYQRPDNSDQHFDDNKPSIPVGLASSVFGALPSFVSKTTNTQKRYGYSGNSFIAVVEFGKRVKAKSLITGGQSFDPRSKHFTDQAQMYSDGKFKDILFYKADVLKNTERTYHPGG